jgi:hypothetical protein
MAAQNRVVAMWWRALGAVLVLLCVGLAGGYAFADHQEQTPASSTTLEPVPGVSPAVPTPDAPTYAPDPDFPPLSTAALDSEPVNLRVDPVGLGVKVSVPVGWQSNRPASTNQWNFVAPDAPNNSYLLRVSVVRGQNMSITSAMNARIGALEQTESDGNIEDLAITAQTDDTFEASYVQDGHLRLTTERFVSFDGSNAYASVAVTGREVDQAGLGALLGRTITSLRELPPKPQGDNGQG